ncbi:hypothetical protein J437_LFUL001320 [Ladona fulva]|uniref:Uncharacterized protein n=1 Tax=Ladona fulva TaxID=123851 RepID=A0A8K0K3A3_LADFU|nr:hypothetical protein J437_LFUL001320 [Ladona fulva]
MFFFDPEGLQTRTFDPVCGWRTRRPRLGLREPLTAATAPERGRGRRRSVPWGLFLVAASPGGSDGGRPSASRPPLCCEVEDRPQSARLRRDYVFPPWEGDHGASSAQ